MTAATEPTWAAGDSVAQVILAFDFDGPTGDAMINGSIWSRPGYFGFGGFDAFQAVPRVLDILKDHHLSATFFTPAWVVRTWPQLCRRIVSEGHEIAGHGDIHEMFWGRSAADQARILDVCQQSFYDVLGQHALGFRAPSGDLAPETPQLLLEHGYIYSSSMRGDDSPYLHPGLDLVEIPAKSVFDDYSVFAYTKAPDFPGTLDRVSPYAAAFRTWRDEIAAAADEGSTVATIWHPKVIGAAGRAVLLDEFVGWLAERTDLRVLRADQVASEFIGSVDHAKQQKATS